MPKAIVVFVTTPTLAAARTIGKRLVEERLAACVNIVPRVESVFAWKGKICRERESLMVIKTRQACFGRLVKRVKSLHPYSIPEVIALPILRGSKDYLAWIDESTKA